MAGMTIPPFQEEGAENERLRFALQAAGIGTWDINLKTQTAWWDDRTRELYGIDRAETRTFETTEELLAYVHSDDQPMVAQAMQHALSRSSNGQYDVEFRITRRIGGRLRWLQAKGQVFFDEHGQAHRFSGTVQDISQQVRARQEAAEAQEGLRGAIELAELGTWQLDLPTGQIDYSPRLRSWHGLEPHEPITLARALEHVHPDDLSLVWNSLSQAITPGSDGYYDVEYRISVPSADGERTLHAQGKVYRNQAGEAYKIGGTVQEVTQQRQAHRALEKQVAQRTQQLENSILDLQRSNENLQQFAYVASHDLQEPLRKIQQFGDLLASRFNGTVGDEGVYVERMQLAARRMSTLIRDLLTFSRLSTQAESSRMVALSDVLQTVLSDLEVVIAETGAVIQVSELPVLVGDPLQLGQLFLNLLSNALKFCRPGVAPVVQIRATRITADELPADVRVTSEATAYHHIEVIDNGIGFDEKYLNRMFQVFQRLHGRREFAGTGIGLAICEKVVVNHGGVITARSEPGQGATFCVYLPA